MSELPPPPIPDAALLQAQNAILQVAIQLHITHVTETNKAVLGNDADTSVELALQTAFRAWRRTAELLQNA